MQGDGQHSIAAELAFQKQLAKQLGLKGSSKAKPKGPDDGLDDLLEGTVITTASLSQRMATVVTSIADVKAKPQYLVSMQISAFPHAANYLN